MRPAYLIRLLVSLWLLCFSILPSRGLTNLVYNGSFEQIGAGWICGGGLGVNSYEGAADGHITVSIQAFLAQELNTIEGRTYMVSFAVNWGNPTVKWGGTILNPFTNYATAGVYWTYGYVYAPAQSNLTRLQFEGIGTIDDVKVVWVEEPIQLVAEPEDRTVNEGSTASFAVRADGVPPFAYQWRFNGNDIAGATNKSLTISPVRQQHAGKYSVLVSNPWTTVTSREGVLQVSTLPTEPVIVAQPVGDRCPVGYGSSLAVLAVGEPPLSYQWHHENVALPEGTNSTLVFDAVDATKAGSYTVLVRNLRGTVLSLPAILTVVTNPSGGGTIYFDTMTNNAPVFDVDASTPLTSPEFVAQVYVSASPDILRPMGPVITFRTGVLSGYLIGIVRQIPDVPAGQFAYVQARAWETAFGPTYEAARANGGKYGFSPVYSVRLNSFGARVPMASFSLRAGEPLFITGKLSLGERLPDGTMQFVLTGERGARYLIESRQLPHHWTPLLILTNTTGTSLFSDPNENLNSVQFYRSRILD